MAHKYLSIDDQMTNQVGKAMFAKAGELGVPVGFMCFKVLAIFLVFFFFILFFFGKINSLQGRNPKQVRLRQHLPRLRPETQEK